MAYRADLHLNGGHRRLVFTRAKEEPFDHVALRLAAYALFWGLDPKAEISPKHPAVAQVEFKPDFIALNEAGEVALWGECGNVSLNKLDKLTRRFPWARIVSLKASEAEGKRMREDLAEGVDRHKSVEVLAFRKEDFSVWRDAFAEVNEVFGESAERSLNLVINNAALACELAAY